MDVSIIISLIALVGTIINIVASVKKNNAEASKTDAEAAGTLVDTSMKVLGQLETRVKCLEEELINMRKQNQKLRAGIRVLIDQLRKLGYEPAWVLEDNHDFLSK